MATPSDDIPLSLSEAARQLGVHPSTLRRWADAGDVAVSVTPGGHRRFSPAEVSRLRKEAESRPPSVDNTAVKTGRHPIPHGTLTSGAETGGLEQHALSHTRSEMRHRDERWMHISENEKEEKRLLGRRLMGLMMQFISADEGAGEPILAEARAIGRIYARGGRAGGMEMTDVLKATLFFRDTIVESAVLMPESAASEPEARARLYRRINAFMNTIQMAIAEVFEKG